MKREIIHNGGRQDCYSWLFILIRFGMDEAELVGLFNVVAPTLRAAKRRII